MNKVVLLLGTNLGDKYENIAQVKNKIELSIGKITKSSEVEQTVPWGFDTDNEFLNQAIEVQTHLSPMKLLMEIHKIERGMGRKKKKKKDTYEDRSIDIDIVYYNNLNFISTRLTIPHYLHTNIREFSKKIIKSLK